MLYTLDKFTAYHPKLQFTLENPLNNHINFLDLTITFIGLYFTTN